MVMERLNITPDCKSVEFYYKHHFHNFGQTDNACSFNTWYTKWYENCFDTTEHSLK